MLHCITLRYDLIKIRKYCSYIIFVEDLGNWNAFIMFKFVIGTNITDVHKILFKIE